MHITNPLESLRRRPYDAPVADQPQTESDKDTKEKATVDDHSASDVDPDAISIDAQPGVQKMEATTKTWTRPWLISAYVLIWVITFVDSIQQSMGFSLAPYVTSSFAFHSLTATTSIVSSLVGGLIKLPLAKVLDIFGRPQGFFVCMWIMVLGLVMMAACQNVETYAAAQVFYWVGYNGVSYCLGIFVADTSALKNRAFYFAFISSPYIATVWIGGPLATAFLNSAGGFRWGYGTFAIVTPVICLPLFFIFWLNYRKAKKAGLIVKRESRGSFLQSCKFYAIEFDVVGILLLAGGLALFLLPFSLYSYQALRWRAPMIICMLVFGVVLIVSLGCTKSTWRPRRSCPLSC